MSGSGVKIQVYSCQESPATTVETNASTLQSIELPVGITKHRFTECLATKSYGNMSAKLTKKS